MLKSKYQPFLFVWLFIVLCNSCLQAQTEDNIIWATAKIQKNIDQKTSIALAPIFRLNEDISNYQNMSIDLSVKRKFGKGWSVQLLERTWFIPDQKSRQFIWLDIGYEKSIKSIKAGTSLRYHYALDINDREDPDFIRWKTTISFLGLGKIKPSIAIEPWFRLNGFESFQRIRYEPGFSYKMTKQLNLTLKYRRELTLNLEPERNFNMYLVTLAYTIPDKQ